MRTPPTAPRRVALAAAALVVAVGACSVSTNDEPVAVKGVFDGLVESTTTSSSTSTPTESNKEVTVYFLRTTDGSTELVPVPREVDIGAGIEDVLANLFNTPPRGEEGPAIERGLGTSISDTATLLSADLVPEEQRLVVDVSGLFGPGGSQGSGLRDALAQIVWTATEDPTVARVSFRNDGNPVGAIVGNGDLVDRPVDRSDYRTLS